MSAAISILAFYKFVSIEAHTALQGPLLQFCQDHQIKGTVLLGAEGINGTVSGSAEAIGALQDYFEQSIYFKDLVAKLSYAEEHPFYRMKVKIKQEIVTIGQTCANPLKQVGTYVEPSDWNDLLNDPEVVLLDTRNDYEVEVGTFRGAIAPNTTNFREFPAFIEHNLDPAKHKKIAMFCTGGIRCEKASSYMLAQGFEQVYHLKGGILQYLEDVPAENSLWEGECFVFDNRVTVNHDLAPGKYAMCHACRHPISPEEMQSPHYVKDISCPRCYDTQTEVNRERAAERAKQMALAEQRGVVHIGS
jgi:UPF0176 protein